MMQRGFVAIFEQDLTQATLTRCVESWLKRFEKVEQVVPGQESTLQLEKATDLMWENNLQFRVLSDERFAWIYVSLEKRTMETTGFQDGEISFCLEVLLELPGVAEIIDEKNQRRLEALEKEGLL